MQAAAAGLTPKPGGSRQPYTQSTGRDRALHCLACFFDTEERATSIARQLEQSHGLPSTQQILLGPAQSGRRAFRQVARRWARRPHAEGRTWLADAPLVAVVGAMLFGLMGAIAVLLDPSLADGQGALVLVLTPLVGLAGGWAAATWLPHPSQYQQFNGSVRRQLALGQWVVPVHDVPWPQQAEVFDRLQAQSVGWCSASTAWRPL